MGSFSICKKCGLRQEPSSHVAPWQYTCTNCEEGEDLLVLIDGNDIIPKNIESTKNFYMIQLDV